MYVVNVRQVRLIFIYVYILRGTRIFQATDSFCLRDPGMIFKLDSGDERNVGEKAP